MKKTSLIFIALFGFQAHLYSMAPHQSQRISIKTPHGAIKNISRPNVAQRQLTRKEAQTLVPREGWDSCYSIIPKNGTISQAGFAAYFLKRGTQPKLADKPNKPTWPFISPVKKIQQAARVNFSPENKNKSYYSGYNKIFPNPVTQTCNYAAIGAQLCKDFNTPESSPHKQWTKVEQQAYETSKQARDKAVEFREKKRQQEKALPVCFSPPRSPIKTQRSLGKALGDKYGAENFGKQWRTPETVPEKTRKRRKRRREDDENKHPITSYFTKKPKLTHHDNVININQPEEKQDNNTTNTSISTSPKKRFTPVKSKFERFECRRRNRKNPRKKLFSTLQQ